MARLSAADQRELQAVKRLCYRGLASAPLREAAGERLRRYIDADAFAFLALEPATGLPIHAVHDWPAGMCEAAHQRALLASPAADFGSRARLNRRAHRIECLVDAERASADPYVSEVLRPFEYFHEVQVSCTSSGRAWGNLHLTRRHGRDPFPDASLALLEALAPHLTAGLRAAATRATLTASPGAGVGMVVLGRGGGIELANDIAMELLRGSTAGERQSRWVAIQTVAGLLRRIVDDGAVVVPALDVVDPIRGEVYRLRAERVRHADGRTRDVVLIEPSRLATGGAVHPMLGLSPREGEVAQAIVRGLTTHEIATSLGLSPHTVQTHVRHIFDKVGVGSRRALASMLTGVKGDVMVGCTTSRERLR
jgi:DNA-binding CsgD family transcriptional regulator